MMASTVGYEPLKDPTTTFRLLKLPSRIGDFCQLKHFSLNDHPKYTALSYTWDSPLLTDDSIAQYNDKEKFCFAKIGEITEAIPISKNLEEALKRIIGSRFCDILKVPGYIWADGICINQIDRKECEMQVPLMGEIYSNCEIGLVWLGSDESDLEGFLHIHDVLEPIISQRETLVPDAATGSRTTWSLNDLELVHGSRIDPHAWAAYVTSLKTGAGSLGFGLRKR